MPKINKIQEEDDKIIVKMRETYEAQLPLIAAILAIGCDEDFDPKELAREAIDIVMAIEEELE